MPHTSRRRCLGSSQQQDHISNLPDELICHILSFIPTKSAVQASALSKRWKYIWRKLTVLDFGEMLHSNYGATLTWQQNIYFRRFVDVLLSHNDAAYIQRLCLYLHKGYDEFYIHSWLDAITRREVGEIVICSRRREFMSLPKALLSSERLVVLKLSGYFTIDVPDPVHLPSLKTLYLIDIHFRSDETLKRLSSSSPVLKELVVKECLVTRGLHVESSSLEELHLERNWGANLIHDYLIIKAPKLTYLHILGGFKQLDLCDLNFLVEVNLSPYKIDDDDLTYDLLSKVCGVSTLTLEGRANCMFTSIAKPPVFLNLTHLKFGMVDESVYEILEFAPRLKFLSSERVCNWIVSEEAKSKPNCLPYLEKVELLCFNGHKNEIKLVAYCLKVAPVLKEIKINMGGVFDLGCFDTCKVKTKRCVFQRLLKLPRASAACQVNVSFDSEESSRYLICEIRDLWPS